MVKEFTRRKTREYLREKYYTRREKILMALGVLILFVILFSALSYSASTNNTILTLIIALVIVVLFPISVFFMDAVFYEHE